VGGMIKEIAGINVVKKNRGENEWKFLGWWDWETIFWLVRPWRCFLLYLKLSPDSVSSK